MKHKIESDWPHSLCPKCEASVDWSCLDPYDVDAEMDCPECGVKMEIELVFRVYADVPAKALRTDPDEPRVLTQMSYD